MRSHLVLALTATAFMAACGDAPDEQDPPGGGQPQADQRGEAPGDEGVIRGWNAAVNRGDYDRAGAYFAQGAIVEQLAEIELDTRADAVAFNRSLPCRADITDIERDEDSTLAAFDLREGPTGECQEGGSARVRFVIRDGEIEEWRQLPPPSQPRGDIA